MVFILVVSFVLIAIFAVISNPDLFSPAKIFLFYFMLFHAGVLFEEITETTIALILLVLSIGLIMAVIEAGKVRRAGATASGQWASSVEARPKNYALFLWIASIPAIFAQIYMIQYFGGIAGYVNSVGLRVVEWAGLGWARTLIALLTPINLVYFAIGLRQRRKAGWWSLYGAHFMLILLIGLLSGSRSSLLNVFVMQIIIFHYLRATVKGQHATVLVGALVLAAMFLGVLRETTRYSGGELTFGAAVSERVLNYKMFYYGVEPLELIARTEHLPLAKGMTFLSLLTNAVPRSLWEDKPITGGVFFTRYYAGDAWEGFSNLTPTFLGEWVINFGWVAGILGFFFAYALIMLLVNRYYLRTVDRVGSSPTDTTAVDAVIYTHILLSVVALMVGEVTNIILSLVISQLVPLLAIRFYVKRVST